ncbi:LysR family transcriptional regulator [Microbacterium lacus]|uniref:LysR family transcriptional regulator n=1 Tax=Microbacterium lacus TaxID=415217 RepID=UPI000C2C2175|nr:LysR substrate-binding domain-containing protein [Microbacterium lacus]
MNLDQLKGFVAIAQVGNFTRAADQLHLAQPSLSRQIAALEHSLGAELFHRSRTGASLTAAGESLLPRARRMLADADSVRRELDELAGLRRGRVRLGATPSLCISLVAEGVNAFRGAHPDIDIHVSEQGSRRLLEELAAGELDFALITASDTATGDGFTVVPLLMEELVVIASTDRPPIVVGDSIRLEQLARLPQIVFSSTYDLRATTDAAFQAAGIAPKVIIEGVEMDAVLRFVERGIGVAIVPATVLLDRPLLRATRLVNPTLTRTISIAQVAGIAPSAAAEAMQRTLAQTATALAARPDVNMRRADAVPT